MEMYESLPVEVPNANALHPCPFCRTCDLHTLKDPVGKAQVCCFKCHTRGPVGSGEKDAAAKWNQHERQHLSPKQKENREAIIELGRKAVEEKALEQKRRNLN